MDTEPAPTQAATPDEPTEHVTAWALDDTSDDGDDTPARRGWAIPIAGLVASAALAAALAYALWPQNSTAPARPATTPATPAKTAPATTPDAIPYWPDGAYLRIFAQNCGDACGPQTRAALAGCPESACATKRADIIALGHEACTAMQSEPLPQIMRELTTPPNGAFTQRTARAVINSAIEVYCPGAAVPLP